MIKRTDPGFNAFLRTEEARQIMDAEWLLALLDAHRVDIIVSEDLRGFAQDHPEDFQVITLDDVKRGVHSTYTMWSKYRLSDWFAQRHPFVPIRSLDGRTHRRNDPVEHLRWAGHFEKSKPPGRPPHDGTFAAFLGSPQGLAILNNDEWARSFADDLCGDGFGGRRRGYNNFYGRSADDDFENLHRTWEESLRSWCPPNIVGEETIAEWVKSADALWTGFCRWQRRLKYGRHFRGTDRVRYNEE